VEQEDGDGENKQKKPGVPSARGATFTRTLKKQVLV